MNSDHTGVPARVQTEFSGWVKWVIVIAAIITIADALHDLVGGFIRGASGKALTIEPAGPPGERAPERKP